MFYFFWDVFCNTIFNSFSFGDNFQHNDYVYLKWINETHYPNLSEIKKKISLSYLLSLTDI